MIIQPEKETRNVNDLFYESEKKRIDMLNREFFHDVELTKKENDVLVWLCGWDNWTIEAVVDVSNRRLSRAISADYFRRKHLSQSAVNEAKAHYIGCHRRLSRAYFSSAMAGLK